MSTDLRLAEQQESTFTRRMAGAIMCLVAVGVLATAMSTDDDVGLVQPAAAAEQTDGGAGYFPAGFPTPQAPVEPHIEAF